MGQIIQSEDFYEKRFFLKLTIPQKIILFNICNNLYYHLQYRCIDTHQLNQYLLGKIRHSCETACISCTVPSELFSTRSNLPLILYHEFFIELRSCEKRTF